MSTTHLNKAVSMARIMFPAGIVAAALLLVPSARGSAPGVTGPTFSLIATDSYITQPDGQAIYSWGYGCNGAPAGFAPFKGQCNTMQIPGPTLIVTEGNTVSVTLTNSLPKAAGNTSLLFPGFQVTAAPAATQPSVACTPSTAISQGLLTSEVTNGCSVTYTFTASSPGTRAYYSGSQGDLQVEMGMYGAIIVLPATIPANCTSGLAAGNVQVELANGEKDFRLAPAAYDHPSSCYDREYLFQFAEIDPRIHKQAETQVNAGLASLNVQTEPYHPTYFMVNGRSMPDDMDPNYASEYPHQPYNGNPHMHPGELVLLRIIGQGRWQHPFHEHGNHVRILARDGNLILSKTNPAQNLAGPLLFTTTTTPGLAMDGIFYWTGKGLNWDVYGHNKADAPNSGPDAQGATLNPTCSPDSNGYYTVNSPSPAPPSAVNYYEWCADHNKPLEKAPFGDVGGAGPATLPDPNYLTNGTWFGGSAYLGPDATVRATGPTGTTPPSGTIGNSPANEAGFAFMWHSHNEREITTNNVFPGGMMMMMLVDSREFVIDESN